MPRSCFVIQPFDGGPYDRRFNEVFAPAIKAAGLRPYRTDNDPSTVVPIESVEEGIRTAAICVADISTNNPNVWYEIGFASAAGIPVILCSRRRPRVPFDIRHRTILIYSTEAPGDFDELKRNVTTRIEALLGARQGKNRDKTDSVSLILSAACRRLTAEPYSRIIGILEAEASGRDTQKRRPTGPQLRELPAFLEEVWAELHQASRNPNIRLVTQKLGRVVRLCARSPIMWDDEQTPRSDKYWRTFNELSSAMRV